MVAGSYASLTTGKLEERTQTRNTFLLSGNVGVSNSAFPKARIVQKRSEYRIRLVWCESELFGCLFVGFFSYFPNLEAIVSRKTRNIGMP